MIRAVALAARWGGASRTAIPLFFACVGCGLVGVAPASAAVTQLGGEGEGAGQFEAPVGIAVAQAQGDVYLVDTGNSRTERFESDGVFRLAWGWGVADGTSEALQSCEALCFRGISGSGAGQFAERPGGIAIDNSLGLSQGDVYVADRENNRIEKFGPNGEFVLMFGGEVNETKDNTPGATEAEKHVCTAASGDVCKAGVVGTAPGEFEPLGPNPIAVDSEGVVYVGDFGRVQKFSESGLVEEEMTLPPESGQVKAVAVDAGKHVYAAYTSTATGEVDGVHKFEACVSSCVVTELGEPRDQGDGGERTIAVGPLDELFVNDREGGRLLEYLPSGEQALSLDEASGTGSIAFDATRNVLYVLHTAVVREVGLPPAGPVVMEGSESVEEVQPTSATLLAVVNPEGSSTTSYHFEYGPTTAYGSSTSVEPLTGEPFEDHAVSASIGALQPSTTYHFRVVVTNAASQTSFGPDETFTTLPAVGVDSESASQVTATSARLATELNPRGLATTYHFEYGQTTEYELGSVPVPDGDAGAGVNDVRFDVLVEGLLPGRLYHYRVVAQNGLGTVQGPDRSFVTRASGTPDLLDGRVWELVSPAEKHGVSLETINEQGALIQASEDGGGLTYVAKAPIDSEPPGNRSIANTQLLATRSAGVWSTENISTRHEAVAGLSTPSEYQLFSSDLSVGVVAPFGATPLAPAASERTPYRREADGEYVPLVNAGNVPPGTKFGGEETEGGLFANDVVVLTATPDASHVLLASKVALTAGFASGGEQSVYEWSGGTLRLVSILPNGVPAAEEGISANVGREGRQVRNAISTDGNRAVFSTAGGGEHLFVRDIGRGETVQLDAPVPGARGGGGAAIYQLASSDGTRVFFTDVARLTVGSTAKEQAPDLYMCEIRVIAEQLSCTLEDLTVDPHPGEPANIAGSVIGSDEAGEHVYFAASGALTAGAVQGACAQGNPGEQSALVSCNLYEHDVASGVTHLVAVVSNRDAPDWGGASGGGNLGELTGRVSENGRWFAFMSQRPLTGFDNHDAQSGELDQEVFLYDRTSESLRCVSCSSSGARPTGVFDRDEAPGLVVDRPLVWAGEWLAGAIPGWTRWELESARHQSRFLSNEGRLFFNSSVGLVAGDANRKMDAYEFEPSGVGGCDLESGCVGLVSSGSSGEESGFLDASTNGDDVFFMTAGKLVPADTDGAFDIYDAHVCSAAVPCPSGVVIVPPACTTADSCRAAPTPQSAVFAAPASAGAGSSGNVPPAVSKPVARPLTRAQKLAKALKACAKKPKRQRAACRARARRRYGPLPHSNKHKPGKKTKQARRGT